MNKMILIKELLQGKEPCYIDKELQSRKKKGQQAIDSAAIKNVPNKKEPKTVKATTVPETKRRKTKRTET